MHRVDLLAELDGSQWSDWVDGTAVGQALPAPPLWLGHGTNALADADVGAAVVPVVPVLDPMLAALPIEALFVGRRQE